MNLKGRKEFPKAPFPYTGTAIPTTNTTHHSHTLLKPGCPIDTDNCGWHHLSSRCCTSCSLAQRCNDVNHHSCPTGPFLSYRSFVGYKSVLFPSSNSWPPGIFSFLFHCLLFSRSQWEAYSPSLLETDVCGLVIHTVNSPSCPVLAWFTISF